MGFQKSKKKKKKKKEEDGASEKKLRMKRKTNYPEKRKNKQTTTKKNNHTLRMQKIMRITCAIVLRFNRFSVLIGKSSPIFSFSFFSPAM